MRQEALGRPDRRGYGSSNQAGATETIADGDKHGSSLSPGPQMGIVHASATGSGSVSISLVVVIARTR